MDKKDKRKKILKISGLIGLFLIVFGLSYALFTVTLNGTKKVKIKTGKLELQLLDKNNNPIYITNQNNTTSYEINLEEQVPVSDEVGLDSTAFEFKLKNSGNLKASYTIYLDDVALESGEERIDDEYIRYSLTKNGSEESPQGLTSRELDKGSIEANNTINEYTLKIWIAEDADNEAMDKVFNATLRVEGTQYIAPPPSPYGEAIDSVQLSPTITATYYQPEEATGYNTNKVKRMSNVEKLDNEETYEGGTLVISGEGEMPDVEGDGVNIDLVLFFLGTNMEEFMNNYQSYIDQNGNLIMKYKPESLIIEEGITKIGKHSFYQMSFFASITFPSTLKEIGAGAFESIYEIKDIVLPHGIESIGDNAFVECNNLHSIRVPGTIQNVGYRALHINNSSSTIYCETQDVANYIINSGTNAQVVVDPTKFE